MRALVLSLSALVAAAPAFADDKCKGEVEAAFVKQRAQPAFRMVATVQTLNGPLVRTIDFVAPDAIYNKIESPTEEAPVETIGIGKWAWANTEGGWEEQPPHNAQVVAQEREAYKVPPKAAADFNCLGKVGYEGKQYVGFGTAPMKDTDGMDVVTTVYLDTETALPAYYVTKSAKAEGPAKFVAVYTYKDITISPPNELLAGSEPKQ